MKKLLSIILVLALFVSIVPMGSFSVSAATSWVGSSTYGWYANDTNSLNAVKSIMKSQTSSYMMERFEKILSEFPLSGYFNSYKTRGCAWHCGTCGTASSSCIRSFYDNETKSTIDLNSTQCYGYAKYCFYRFFKTFSYKTITLPIGLSENTLKSTITTDMIGSHFRSRGHSLVFLAKDSSNLYFIDANSGYNSATGCASGKCSNSTKHYSTECKINLRRYSYSEFVTRFSSYGVTIYSPNSHTHNYNQYVYNWDAHPHYKCYKCSCGAVKENTAEPTTVATCEKCVPNLFVQYNANGGSVNSSKSSTYYLTTDGTAKKHSDDSYYTQSWIYGKSISTGFVDDTTLGFVKSGYTFKGWSLSRSGGTVYDKTTARKPEDFYPNIKNGSATITVYAVWEPNVLTVRYNANGGYINSEKSSTYYLDSDNTIRKCSNDWYYSDSWKYGVTQKWGFTDQGTVGLARDGYKFLGWAMSKDGGTVYDTKTSRIAEDIYPNLKNGNSTITMYAVWEELKTYNYYDWRFDFKKFAQLLSDAMTSDGSMSAVMKELNNGLVETKQEDLDGKITPPVATERPGYKFTGWKTLLEPNQSVKGVTLTIGIVQAQYEKLSCEKGEISHTYTNACDKSCNICGSTRTTTHNYKEATCTKPKTCRVCGKTSGKSLGHNYVMKYKKATFSADGKNWKECTRCGKKKDEKVTRELKKIVLSKTSYTYDGKTHKPKVTIYNENGNPLTTKFYTVEYKGGKNVGKHKVIVKFHTKYSGTKEVTFKINPTKTSIEKLTARKKALKIKIKKQTKQVTGYEIKYSTSPTFKAKYTKSKSISSYKTVDTTIKNLKANKTYYVKVRTYKRVDGKKYYSAWSKVKTKKTK